MLIETDTGGEREIGANPYEHSSPMGVLDIEVILIDPTPLHLEMPTIVFPDGGHVGGGLTCFDNGYNLIGLGTLEVALHKVIAPAWGIFLNGYTPSLGVFLDIVGIVGVAGAPCWRSTRSRRASRKRKLTAWRYKCDEQQSRFRPTSPKDFVGVGKRTKHAI